MKPKGRRKEHFSVYMAPDTLDRLKSFSSKIGVPLSDWLVKCGIKEMEKTLKVLNKTEKTQRDG